ncbi:helix-turn-helix domain-containing protein [Frigidibacter sp. MR17.14]|uniref:helix-turn-helix domain-containing protein n=1 Tax=Frigidibacter sp. MR17.14 TaxID=3126509 RepID=UPI003012BE10
MTAPGIFTEDDRAALIAAVPELGVRMVLDAFVAETGIPLDWLMGSRRDHAVLAVRQRAMFRAWQLGYSPACIAKAMNRDHTTVSNGIRAEVARCGLDMETLRRERAQRGQGQDDDSDHAAA